MRSLIALLLLAAGLGAALYFTDQRPAEENAGSLTVRALGEHAFGQATKIRIRRARDIEIVEVRRIGAEWRLTEPIRDLASTAVLESIANAYDSAMLVPNFEADEVDEDKLKQCGFDPEPVAWIEFEFPDRADRMRLALGETGPLNTDRFVRRTGDDRLFLASNGLFTTLQHNPADFREPFVIANQPADVQRLRITRRTTMSGAIETLEIARAAGVFRLVEPDYLLDPGTIVRFLQIITSMKADRFLAGRFGGSDAVSQGPQVADVSIEIEGRRGTENLELFFAPGGLRGWHEQRKVAFEAEQREFEAAFKVPLQELRSRALLSFRPDDLEEIRLDPGAGQGKVVVLERDGDRFQLTEPIRNRGAVTPINELLAAVRQLTIDEFVKDDADDETLASYGLGDGAARIALRGTLRTDPDEFVLGNDFGDEYSYVRRAGERHVALIRRRLAEQFRRPYVDFVGLGVLSVDRRELIRRVSVASDSGAQAEFTRDDEAHWQPRQVGEIYVREAIELLAALEAVAAVDPTTFDSAAVRERIGYSLQRENGDELASVTLLVVGDGESERVLAEHPNRKVLYVLSGRDARDLRGLLE